MEIPVHSRAATALLEIFRIRPASSLRALRGRGSGRRSSAQRGAAVARLETVACLDLEPHGGLISATSEERRLVVMIRATRRKPALRIRERYWISLQRTAILRSFI